MPPWFASFPFPDYVSYLVAAVAVYTGSLWYHGFACRHDIIARINSRTLHTRLVPRGAGVVLGSVFVLFTTAAWTIGVVPQDLALGLIFGGAVATLVGFADDVWQIRASWKLGIHACLALCLLFIWYRPLYAPALAGSAPGVRLLALALLAFVPVWLINMYNFIDGIDGMASGGAVFICATTVLVLHLKAADSGLIFTVTLLGCCCLGFLFLNLPPARMFMGDAGSIFLGFSVSAVAIWSILSGQIGAWTWLVILSYFIGDTTTTTLSRMVLVPKWYGVHRSHAYQNLARIMNSHARVVYGVTLYHFCWALPLAVWSTVRPEYGPLAAVLSLGPVVLWTLRFGPRFSSD